MKCVLPNSCNNLFSDEGLIEIWETFTTAANCHTVHSGPDSGGLSQKQATVKFSQVRTSYQNSLEDRSLCSMNAFDQELKEV